MLGAIIGDIVGSRFEWNNIKTKEFEFLTYRCFPTDDSIMSLAVAQAILNCNGSYDSLSDEAIKSMQKVGRPYPDCGYGGSFRRWKFQGTTVARRQTLRAEDFLAMPLNLPEIHKQKWFLQFMQQSDKSKLLIEYTVRKIRRFQYVYGS